MKNMKMIIIVIQAKAIIIIILFGMDQILDKSYFKTTIKDKYSFPKEKRFPHLQSKYTIDYYDASSTSGKRSTSFGYGSKYDFFKKKEMRPSPFEYTIGDKDQLTRGISFGMGRDNIKVNSYIDSEKLKTPRAGQVISHIMKYEDNALKLKKKEPSCYLIGKHPSDSFIKYNDNPEPSKYYPNDTFYSKRKRSAQFGFGSARRFNQEISVEDRIVGPGSYNISPKNTSNGFIIAHAMRKTYAVEEIEKSITPGPKYLIK